MESITLSSESMGNKLLRVIYINIGAIFMMSFHDIIEPINPVLYEKYNTGILFIVAISLINIILMLVFGTKWIYRTHVDLNNIFPDYPISPKQSMKMTWIPIYNAWGIWKIFKTKYEMIKMHGFNMKWFGFSIQSLYIMLWIFSTIDKQMTKISLRGYYANFDSSEKLWFQIVAGVAATTSAILMFGIVKMIREGMEHIKNEQTK